MHSPRYRDEDEQNVEVRRKKYRPEALVEGPSTNNWDGHGPANSAFGSVFAKLHLVPTSLELQFSETTVVSRACWCLPYESVVKASKERNGR